MMKLGKGLFLLGSDLLDMLSPYHQSETKKNKIKIGFAGSLSVLAKLPHFLCLSVPSTI